MPQVTPDPAASRGNLYKLMTDEGLYTKSQEDFNLQFSNPESQIKLHNLLTEKKLYTKSTDDFTNQFFGDLKKKVQSDSETSGQASPEALLPGSEGAGRSSDGNVEPSWLEKFWDTTHKNTAKVTGELAKNPSDYPELLAEGAVQTAVNNPVKLLGAIDEVIWNKILDNNYESPATRAGKALDKFYEADVPDEVRQGFPGQVAKGIGTAAGMIMSGKPTLAASPLAKAPTALKTIKDTFVNTRAVQGGAMTSVPEYEAAKAAGVPKDQLFGILAKNYLVGQTEPIAIGRGLERTFGKLNSVIGGRTLTLLEKMGIGAFEEALQEGVQTYLTNQIAKDSYDPNRDPFWNVAQSMSVGGVVGAILPGIGGAMQAASPEERAKIQNKVQDLKALNIKAPEGDLGKQPDLTPEKQAIIDKVNNGEEISNQEADVLLDRSTPEVKSTNPVEKEDLTPEKQAVIDKVNNGEQLTMEEADLLTTPKTSNATTPETSNTQAKNEPVNPKQKAKAEVDALVASGDLKRGEGNKITMVTEKGVKELKRITEELNGNKAQKPAGAGSGESSTVRVQGSDDNEGSGGVNQTDEQQGVSGGKSKKTGGVLPVTERTGNAESGNEGVSGKGVAEQSTPAVGTKIDYLDHTGVDRTGVVTGIAPNGKIIVNSKDYNPKGEEDTIKPEKVIGKSKRASNSQDLSNALDALENKTTAPEVKKSKPTTGPITTVNLLPAVELFKVAGKILNIGWAGLDKGQKLIFGETFKKLENAAAKLTQKGVAARNPVVRSLAQGIRNLIGGLPYEGNQLADKRQFIGNKNFGHLRAKLMAANMYKLIDSDVHALARVHAVLDPEAYAQDPNLAGMTYAQLSPEEQGLHDAIRTVNDFVHEWSHKNGFISDETYDEHKGKYIARMYEDFEFLPDDVANAMRSSRADLTMYKQRVENDNEILKDPVYATAKRVAQIMQNQAIFDYADQVEQSGLSSATEQPGYVQLGQPGGKPFYGALTGKFVPSYIAEDFKGFMFMNALTQKTFELFRGYDRLAIRQFMKRSNTVYNPIVQLGNFLSNYSFAFAAGLNPLTFSKNLVKARSEIKQQGPIYQELVKEGLIGTDNFTTDITPTYKTPPKSLPGKVYDKFSQKAIALYSGADDVAKVAAYMTAMESNKDSHKEAVDRVYEGFQNYATVGKAYDFASKTPLIGNPYIKFKADLGRIIKNAVTRRPLTVAAYLGILYWLKEMLSDKSGEDDDVKKIRERRDFTPKIKTPVGDLSMLWQVPGVGEVNFARFLTPYYVYDKGTNDNMVSSATEWLPYQWTPNPKDDNVLEGIAFSDVLLGPYVQLALDRDFRGKSIMDPQATKFSGEVATAEERTMNAVNYIVRSQVPLFGRAQDLIAAYNGESDYYGRDRSIAQAVMNNIIKVQEFGPGQAKESLIKEITTKASQIEGLTREIAQLHSIYIRDMTNIMKSDKTMEQKLALQKIKMNLFMERRADKLEKQVELVKALQDPHELLKSIK